MFSRNFAYSHDGSTFLRVGMPHEKDLGTVPQINIRISPALQLPNLTMLVRAICPTSKFAFLSYSNVCTLASQELQVLYKLDIPERDEDEVVCLVVRCITCGADLIPIPFSSNGMGLLRLDSLPNIIFSASGRARWNYTRSQRTTKSMGRLLLLLRLYAFLHKQ